MSKRGFIKPNSKVITVPEQILDNFTKEQLYVKWQEEKARIIDVKEKSLKEKKELLKQTEILTRTVEDLQSKIIMNKTDVDVLKRILKFRAENKSPIDILYRLELLGVDDIELEDIENLISGELSSELEKYYNECKKEWIDKIKMNAKEYRYSVIEDLQRQLDKAKKYQEFCQDPEKAHEVSKDIKSLLDAIGKIARDLDDVTPENQEKERANDITNNLIEKSKKSVVKLNLNKDEQIITDAEDIPTEFLN